MPVGEISLLVQTRTRRIRSSIAGTVAGTNGHLRSGEMRKLWFLIEIRPQYFIMRIPTKGKAADPYAPQLMGSCIWLAFIRDQTILNRTKECESTGACYEKFAPGSMQRRKLILLPLRMIRSSF